MVANRSGIIPFASVCFGRVGSGRASVGRVELVSSCWVAGMRAKSGGLSALGAGRTVPSLPADDERW